MTTEKAVHPPRGMYHFSCSCGGAMAVNGALLDLAIAQNKEDGRYVYKCPNRLYGKCNKSYSPEYIRDHAKFIPPIHQGL